MFKKIAVAIRKFFAKKGELSFEQKVAYFKNQMLYANPSSGYIEIEDYPAYEEATRQIRDLEKTLILQRGLGV